MNYRHVYHAGGFHDVVKHVMITALFSCFSRKTTPFCYIDTHAGPGYYDLFSEFAAKKKEYGNGIEKVIRENDRIPSLIKQYVYCIHKINNQLSASHYASLRYYPGSPLLARTLARPHDRIIACELHPEEYQALKTTFRGDKQVAVHHLDGFLGLKAFLPPHERRGFVLIDPPYENPDEFTRIARTLPMALKRWETGTFAIWYPIKEKIQLEPFYRALRTPLNQPILVVELTIYPDLPQHLNGCGVAIINPPWQLTDLLNETLPWLWKTLSINHQGGYRAHLLK